MKRIRKVVRKNKKGFTLIELMVVMGVVAVLVLLAAPNFSGKTEEAVKSKHVANARKVEEASERYFLDEKDWPRLTDDAYTHREIEAYADTIYSITGEEVTLNPNGNYYDIDYDALSKYVTVAEEDKNNYILQNPVGKIYYLEGLSDEGKTRVDYERPSDNAQKPSPTEEKLGILSRTRYENDNVPIVFKGLSINAFDGNQDTYHSGVGVVTWEGNLEDKEIEMSGKGYNRTWRTYVGLNMEFLDSEGNIVKPVNSITDSTTITSNETLRTVKRIVPPGATQMRFYAEAPAYDNRMQIHDIKVSENQSRPAEYDVSSTSTPHSITLKWEGVKRASIYKDGVLLTNVNGQSYTDAPLYSDTSHTYEIVLIDDNGNGQRLVYKGKTSHDVVNFRGLLPEVFDGNPETMYYGTGTATWIGDLSNKKIAITGKGYNATWRSHYGLHMEFLDQEGNVVKPKGWTENHVTISSNEDIRTVQVIVPEGATQMRFYPEAENYNEHMRILDITIAE